MFGRLRNIFKRGEEKDNKEYYVDREGKLKEWHGIREEKKTRPVPPHIHFKIPKEGAENEWGMRILGAYGMYTHEVGNKEEYEKRVERDIKKIIKERDEYEMKKEIEEIAKKVETMELEIRGLKSEIINVYERVERERNERIVRFEDVVQAEKRFKWLVEENQEEHGVRMKIEDVWTFDKNMYLDDFLRKLSEILFADQIVRVIDLGLFELEEE